MPSWKQKPSPGTSHSRTEISPLPAYNWFYLQKEDSTHLLSSCEDPPHAALAETNSTGMIPSINLILMRCNLKKKKSSRILGGVEKNWNTSYMDSNTTKPRHPKKKKKSANPKCSRNNNNPHQTTGTELKGVWDTYQWHLWMHTETNREGFQIYASAQFNIETCWILHPTSAPLDINTIHRNVFFFFCWNYSLFIYLNGTGIIVYSTTNSSRPSRIKIGGCLSA